MKTKLQRPYVLTPETQATIVLSLAEGNYIKTACEGAGTTYDCFRHWQRRWEEDDPVAQEFADFFKAVKKAVAQGEENALRTVVAGDTGWQGSAWFLERRFPKRWCKKDHLTLKSENVDVKTLTDAELEAIASGKSKS